MESLSPKDAWYEYLDSQAPPRTALDYVDTWFSGRCATCGNFVGSVHEADREPVAEDEGRYDCGNCLRERAAGHPNADIRERVRAITDHLVNVRRQLGLGGGGYRGAFEEMPPETWRALGCPGAPITLFSTSRPLPTTDKRGDAPPAFAYVYTIRGWHYDQRGELPNGFSATRADYPIAEWTSLYPDSPSVEVRVTLGASVFLQGRPDASFEYRWKPEWPSDAYVMQPHQLHTLRRHEAETLLLAGAGLSGVLADIARTGGRSPLTKEDCDQRLADLAKRYQDLELGVEVTQSRFCVAVGKPERTVKDWVSKSSYADWNDFRRRNLYTRRSRTVANRGLH